MSFDSIAWAVSLFLPFGKYAFLLSAKFYARDLSIRSQPSSRLLLLAQDQALIGQLNPLSCKICFGLIHGGWLYGIIGVSSWFRSQLAKLFFLNSFELRVAIVVYERSHILVPRILSHYNPSVVLRFDSVVGKRLIISWNTLILAATLAVIGLVSTSDTNVSVRWFALTVPIYWFIISRHRTCTCIKLIPTLDGPWSPLSRSLIAI